MKFKYKFRGIGLGTADKREASRRFSEYQKTYHIERPSDLQLLEEKCFIEIQLDRVKKKIHQLNSNSKIADENLVPREWQKLLELYLEQVLKINDKLGLYEDRKKENDGYVQVQLLKKKLFQWREENPNRFKKCPKCKEPIEVIVNPKNFDIIKHPFYKNNMLYNEQAFKLLEEGKISKLECEKIHKGMRADTSDYIEWILKDKERLDKK